MTINQREVLGTTEIDSKSLADTITLVEAKGRAARALNSGDLASGVSPATSVSGISSYKKSQQGVKEGKMNCTVCNKLSTKFGKNRIGQTVEYTKCLDCFRASRRKRPNTRSDDTQQKSESSAAISQAKPVFEVIGSIKDVCDNYLYDD